MCINGVEERPRKEIQRLSDLYRHGEDINLKLICTVYNINPGYNEDIRRKSEVLDGYTVFVEKVRKLAAKEDEEAVLHAVEYCIESGILAEFFATRKKEVVKNMTIDMTFERRLELSAIENRDEGREEGREIVIVDKVIKKVARNKSLIQIADELEEDIFIIRNSEVMTY